MPTHNRIDYIEFQVADLAESKAFYAKAFGWTFNTYGDTYAGIVDGNGEIGGFEQVDTPATGGPLVILFSDDLTASLEAVKGAGGTISTAPFDFPGGRRFHFIDPTGHELAVWAEPT